MHTFGFADLPGQFVLAESDQGPTGWRRHSLNGWTLAVEPRLPVHQFARGWIIGFPIDPMHPHVGAAETLARCESLFDIETLLDRLSGRFILISLSNKGNRIYLDASGALAAVYSPTQRLVASTSALVHQDANSEDDAELIDAMNVRRSSAFFAFGTTPRRDVFRLLPNHYLELGAFRAIRHWPRYKAFMPQDVAVERIGDLARGVIKSVCARHQPYLSLTAGRDSRMLLALSKDMLQRIRFMTWAIPGAETDLTVARQIARRFGLHHEIIEYQAPHPHDIDQWMYRSGGSVGEPRGMDFTRSFRQMDRETPYLPGLASEVGRAFYWREGDEDRGPLGADELVRRLRLPLVNSLVGAAARWLEGLPLTHPCDVLDIAYIEQRLGCWASVEAYTHDGVHRVTPFSNRSIFESMMALPYEHRRAQRMTEDVIRAHWPELLRLPFNSGPKTWGMRAKRLFARTPLLWRFTK